MLNRPLKRLAYSVTAVALAAAAGAAHAGTADAAGSTNVLGYTASDDTYASSGRPSSTHGGSPKLVAGRLHGDTTVTYLTFKVAALAPGGTVRSAQIRLTRDEHHLPGTVRISAVTSRSWSERSLTARNAPALGAVLDTEHPTRATTVVTFDVTRAIRRGGTFAFAITSPATNDVARFRSTEFGSNGPALSITVATPAPPAAPGTPPTATKPTVCTVNAKLVPSCGILWGAAAGGFSTTPRDAALREWERKTGRTASIYHTYHRGDELFPTKAEIAMTREAGRPRVLMLNWKVAYGTTWARVAAGEQDARIDRLAAHLKATFTDKFFLVLHHEPENDVNPAAGSGQQAKDFAAMFRHTVERLKAKGVNNAVFTVAYMNIEKWNNAPWWVDLYPGDAVVDWIALDAYVASQPNGYHYGGLDELLNRTNDPAKFPGFYTWVTTQHPDKPFLLAEWGVHENAVDATTKPKLFASILNDLKKYPAVKGMVYFDTAADQAGHDIRIDSSAASLTEFAKIAADPRFAVKLR